MITLSTIGHFHVVGWIMAHFKFLKNNFSSIGEASVKGIVMFFYHLGLLQFSLDSCDSFIKHYYYLKC